MVRDEAMLIKQWDSFGPLAQSDGKESDASVENAPCTFSFHSAFEDLSVSDDAPDRWSIEVRCLVIYRERELCLNLFDLDQGTGEVFRMKKQNRFVMRPIFRFTIT